MRARLLAAAAVAALTVACGDDNSTATSPTVTSTPTSVTYTGTLDVGGSRFYSFTNAAAGSVTAFLASVTTTDGRTPIAMPLEVGVGIPAGTGCPTTTTQIVAPGLVSQLNVSLAAGVFCLRIADAGELKGPVAFAVRFIHP